MDLNTYDLVLMELFKTDINDFTRTEALEIISDGLRITKQEAVTRLKNTLTRSGYLDTLNSTPKKYKISTKGKYRATDVRDNETSDKTSPAVVDFLKHYYDVALMERVKNEDGLLQIKYSDLEQGLNRHAELLLTAPEEVLSQLNQAIADSDYITAYDCEDPPKASIIQMPEVLNVEDVKTEHIGKFIQVEGRVISQTQIRSELILGAFKCARCEYVTFVKQYAGKYYEPAICENDICNRKGPFKLLDGPESVFIDGEEIIIESLNGDVTMPVHLYTSLCKNPWELDGKVIHVCGRIEAWQINTKAGKTTGFRRCIVGNSVCFAEDSQSEPPTKEDIELFEEWAKNPVELRQKIVASIAPNISGLMSEKDACSLSLFSAWAWGLDPHDVIERSSLHVGLIGDPGVAKSQIVKDTIYLAPKGKFAHVPAMSKGGMGTVATTDANGEWVIKAGFFSQTDQGLSGLDEIDKLNNKDDWAQFIHVMNDQEQIVNKAGKNNVGFNTRTAILATANPKDGYFDKYGNILAQLGIPVYITSRFDLIFVIFDVADREHDRVVAESINELHKDIKITRKEMERPINEKLFRKFVLYANSRPAPPFEDGAHQYITEYYLKLRGVPQDTPLIGARQVNDMNRLARAIAMRELSKTVTEEHAKYAISLMRKALSSLTPDEDYGMMNVGNTKSQTELIRVVRSSILEICKRDKCAMIKDIAFTGGIEEMEVEHSLVIMMKNGESFKTAGGYRMV